MSIRYPASGLELTTFSYFNHCYETVINNCQSWISFVWCRKNTLCWHTCARNCRIRYLRYAHKCSGLWPRTVQCTASKPIYFVANPGSKPKDGKSFFYQIQREISVESCRWKQHALAWRSLDRRRRWSSKMQSNKLCHCSTVTVTVVLAFLKHKSFPVGLARAIMYFYCT